MYEALTRSSVVIELIEDIEQYEATIVSTNGVILQPYDTSTTLIGTVLKNKIDITNKIKNIKWTKWNPTEDNMIECPEWNENHKGMSTIQVTKEDVDSKSIFAFEVYNDYGDLLCSASISIIDINDLLVSTIKPDKPYVGQLWVDDSTEPATLYVWNGYKWVIAGSVGAIVKNLLRNTSFVYNADHWDIVGDTKLSFTPYAIDHLGHRFLKLNSDVVTGENRGISQTTTDIINTGAEYSFQMLFYSIENTETFSNNIFINIYSVNDSNKEDLLCSKTVSATKDMQRLFVTFKTLNDTKSIRVEIIGEANYRYNFQVGELALYNTWNDYPWTINPLDLNLEGATYTQEQLWAILSSNGTVQGIFSRTNPVTGQLEYYINASYIGAGKVKAEFMEMYGLKVRRKDDPDTITFEITENGEVNLNVTKLVLESTGEVIDDVINNIRQEISPEGIKETVTKLITDENGDVHKQILSIAEQTAEGFTNTVKDELNGKISSLQQTVDGFDQRVEDAEGNLSQINQDIESISGRVKDVESGQESLVKITAKGVYVGSGNSLIDINGNKISIATDSFEVNADNIKLEGYTTINGGFGVDLEGNMFAKNGTFEGTISASEIDMSKIKGSKLIAPNIVSDETENPKFSLTEDGTLTALNAVVKGEVSGTIFTGDTFMSSNRKFAVLANGTLQATDANIKGNITAGSTITGATVKGGTVIGTTIQNAEEDPTFIVTAEGTVTGANIKGGTIGIGGSNYDAFTVDNYGNCNISKGTINIGNNFIVSNDGSLTATSANISGNITSGSVITGAVISGGRIDIGNGQFTVDENGKLTAKDAVIDATMEANTGYIAGFKISDNNLTATNVGVSSSSIKDAIAFWAGSDNITDAPFKVSNKGALNASNVHITGGVLDIGNGNFVVDASGNLTAKTGSFHGDITAGSTITGATIQNTNGSFKVDSEGNITGAKISGSTITGTDISGGTLQIGSKFSVDNSGALVATSADISGTISATSGTIGGFTIDGYKIKSTNIGMCSSSSQEWAFWAGADYGSDAPFHVGHDGELYATKANITGTISGSTIKGGTLEIGNNFNVDDSGVLTATSAKIKGDITGSNITGSTFAGLHEWFKVDEGGSCIASDIDVTGTVTGKNIIANETFSAPYYDRCLTDNVTVYVTYGYDYNNIEPDEDDFKDGMTFASFADLQDVVPRNLNGYTLDIYVTAKHTENITLNNFNGGRVRVAMQGHQLNGCITFFGHNMDYEFYGNKPGSTNNSSIYCNIKPGANGKLQSNYRYCLVGDRCRLTVYDVRCYKGSATDYANNGICCTNGCIGYLSSITAVNSPNALIRCHSASHIYVASTSGTTSAQTFQAVSGSIIHLNKGTHCGTSSSSGAKYTNNNAQIFDTGVTYTNTTREDTSTPTPSVPDTITVSKTIKSSTGSSWRTSGSYANSWSSDAIVRQGCWSSGYGKNIGYWFFGNNIYNIIQNSSNTVTAIKIKITRNSGGTNAAVTHYLRAHTLEGKSNSPSQLGTGTLNKKFSLAVGSSITISLSASEIAAFKSNKARGFGLCTSDYSTGSGGSYSCCSASCSVTITYKRKE